MSRPIDAADAANEMPTPQVQATCHKISAKSHCPIDWRRAFMMMQDTACGLEKQVAVLERALLSVINLQPCCDDGGCFYPVFDGDGNEVGQRDENPLNVIQGMAETAQAALAEVERMRKERT